MSDAVRTTPELIGHRGAPRDRTENTLPAFERALELGVDAIELDVHLTRDGIAVVHHDPMPRATARGAKVEVPLGRLDYEEVRTLRFPDGAGIPTLAETVTLVGDRCTLYVEIKSPRPGRKLGHVTAVAGGLDEAHARAWAAAVALGTCPPEST